MKTNKGVTAISVGFDHPLNPASASNTALYHVLEGVKKKGKTVYTKSLKVVRCQLRRRHEFRDD